MSKVHGYLEIDALIVVEACEGYLKDRYERQEKAKQEYIDRQMNKKWFPAKTEAEAEKRAWDLDSCEYSIGDGYKAGVVQSIQRQAYMAVKVCGTVSISDDLTDLIFQYMRIK